MYKFLLFFSFFSLLQSDEHSFKGKHFLASYCDCDLRAISNLEGLISAMDEAVRASGAKILEKTPYIFPPNGLTIVYLLSESHASLHTYPEFGHCFVDLFTCGENCFAEAFHSILKNYLQPRKVDTRLFLREEEILEVPFSR